MISQDSQDLKEFEKEKQSRLDKLINTIMTMPEPDMFGSGEQTEEEKSLYKRISHAKSNFRIIKGVGSMCNCGHGKADHFIKDINVWYVSWGNLACGKKTCKCQSFARKH